MNPRSFRRRLIVALAAALPLAGAVPLWGHDIPARVTVLAFVKPEGHTLQVIVRVPLEAMRDVRYPVRGPGYLDIPNAGPMLTDAARLWIAQASPWLCSASA